MTETAKKESTDIVHIAPPRLPYHSAIEERFGIDKSDWRTLTDAIFPSAKTPEGVILALGYCKSRGLDVFKHVVHIVPMWNSALNREVETVWPGIAELRTTAFRTGNYGGCDAAEFGPDVTKTFKGRVKKKQGWEDAEATVTFPEWAQITVYRLLDGQRYAIPGPRVYWEETYAGQFGTPLPNSMWQRRPRGQLEKCAEAAALRRAFPEELGNELVAEEMEGAHIGFENAKDVTPKPRPTRDDPPDEPESEPEANITDVEADTGEEAYTLIDEVGDTVSETLSPAEFAGEIVVRLKSASLSVEQKRTLWENNNHELTRLCNSQHREGCFDPLESIYEQQTETAESGRGTDADDSDDGDRQGAEETSSRASDPGPTPEPEPAVDTSKWGGPEWNAERDRILIAIGRFTDADKLDEYMDSIRDRLDGMRKFGMARAASAVEKAGEAQRREVAQ